VFDVVLFARACKKMPQRGGGRKGFTAEKEKRNAIAE
jgi:hypothetical protein